MSVPVAHMDAETAAALAQVKKEHYSKGSNSVKLWPNLTADYAAWDKAYNKSGLKTVLHKLAKKLKKRKVDGELYK